MKIIWLFTCVYGKTRWNFKSSYFQLCSFPGDFAYDLFEVSLYSVYNDSISSYVSNLLAFWCRITNINILRYCLWIITLIWSTVLTKKGQIYEYAMVKIIKMITIFFNEGSTWYDKLIINKKETNIKCHVNNKIFYTYLWLQSYFAMDAKQT